MLHSANANATVTEIVPVSSLVSLDFDWSGWSHVLLWWYTTCYEDLRTTDPKAWKPDSQYVDRLDCIASCRVDPLMSLRGVWPLVQIVVDI